MKNSAHHIIMVVIIALCLMMPAYQMLTKQFEVRALHGVTNQQTLPTFNTKDWLSFKYQPQLHQYLLENFGFRPYFIRSYNQLLFSLFGKYNQSIITYGKEGYLYEPWFIRDYYGRTFIGDSLIENKVQKLKAITEKLDEKNTQLMVVLAPGKASYFPEYIPERLKSEKQRNNYEAYKDHLSQYQIPVLDVNEWFVQAKDTTRFPLFTKTATHWSAYAAQLALDSIVQFMEKQLDKPLAKLSFQNFREIDDFCIEDYDIESIMNLLFDLDRGLNGTVDITAKTDSSTFKPNVVCISDSFYWLLFGQHVKHSIYNSDQYWYYNQKVYPESFKTPTTAEDLNLSEVIQKTDVFILMACPSTIEKFSWGFIDRAYQELVLNPNH